MESLIIRPVTFADYEAISLLLEHVDQLHADGLPDLFQRSDGPARSQEWFAQIRASQEVALFVAEQQTLVGLALCQVRRSPVFPLFVPRRYVHINELIVHPSFQGQGIGRLLLQRVHEWAQELEITEVELDVYEFNTSARLFYERLGYQTIRRTLRHRF